VLTALTPANKENGCLQVIKGSHKLGRIDHGTTGEQVGANQDRVEEALHRMELVYVEMEPGDTLFFHSNILHRSDRNNSSNSRWSLISAYNLITNKPFKSNNTSSFTPINKVPDIAILEYNAGSISEDADFLVK
jgi:phytanoyl-CoA hydroxylase